MMIRKATDRDIGRIAEILVFNNRIHYFPIFKDIAYSFGEMNVLSVSEHLKKDVVLINHTYVFEETVIKGFISVVEREIVKLYVEPFFQKRGIGEKLIEFAIKMEKAEHLWALEKNTGAIRFYKKHGFHMTGEKKLEEGTDEYLVHLVQMDRS